jgi:hypothetical protein
MKVPNKCKEYLRYKYGGKVKSRTPRKAIDYYFSSDYKRAKKIFMDLCLKKGSPEGWTWEKECRGNYRKLPLPWKKHSKSGQCNVCGNNVYALGWHSPWGDKKINKKANWHSVCLFIYLKYTRPKKKRGYQIDHHTPLYRVYRVWKDKKDAWPIITHFWSPENIQYITTQQHKKKNAKESQERAKYRKND